ncbi:MAG: hypothetical protein ABFD07_02340, partial [Methanobacterium sp.]
MTEIEIIIEYFKYINVKFIEEYTYRSHNKLQYETKKGYDIEVFFNFETGKISYIKKRNPRMKSIGKTYTFEKFMEKNKSKMRDFKIGLLF